MGKICWPETLRQKQIVVIVVIHFYRGCSWPAPHPSGFGSTEVNLPAVNATCPPSLQFWLKGFLDSTDGGCVASYTSWRLSKKAILTHDSCYCSSVAGRSPHVCVHICLFRVMAHRVSDVYISKQDAYISPSPCPLYVGRNIPSSVGFEKHFVSGYLCIQIENKECPKECRVMPITLTPKIFICLSHTSLSWTH